MNSNPTSTSERLSADSTNKNIADLVVGEYRWTICGQVIRKTAVKPWNRGKTNGTVMSFVLKDITGELYVTAFNQDCAFYAERIKVKFN